MRGCQIPILVLCFLPASSQTVPQGWKVIKDAKHTCQIAVPPEWVSLDENSGAAVLQDSTTAIVVVTSQAGQAFKPLPESVQRALAIRRERLFENSVKRLFYQDTTSRNSPKSAV